PRLLQCVFARPSPPLPTLFPYTTLFRSSARFDSIDIFRINRFNDFCIKFTEHAYRVDADGEHPGVWPDADCRNENDCKDQLGNGPYGIQQCLSDIRKPAPYVSCSKKSDRHGKNRRDEYSCVGNRDGFQHIPDIFRIFIVIISVDQRFNEQSSQCFQCRHRGAVDIEWRRYECNDIKESKYENGGQNIHAFRSAKGVLRSYFIMLFHYSRRSLSLLLMKSMIVITTNSVKMIAATFS